MAAARWFLPVPGLPEKIKLAILPSNSPWKIVDKKVAKRTAVQEQIILPLRAQNYATLVPGKKSERTVFTMAKFTIPDDKCLVVELNEKASASWVPRPA